MLQEHPAVKEQNGICYYKYFRGIPDYGQGIEPPDSGDAIYVKDFGVYQKDIICLLYTSDLKYRSSIGCIGRCSV